MEDAVLVIPRIVSSLLKALDRFLLRVKRPPISIYAVSFGLVVDQQSAVLYHCIETVPARHHHLNLEMLLATNLNLI